ncbi:hypothetical protein ACFLTZ_04405 [Chloroflexota bacterium]
MIKSIGMYLAGVGEHKIRCLDEEAQLCDGFGFETTPEGLAKLEERVSRDGSNKREHFLNLSISSCSVNGIFGDPFG